MKETRVMVRISEEKKKTFQEAIEKLEPNLNMAIVIRNMIDEYIKKANKKEE